MGGNRCFLCFRFSGIYGQRGCDIWVPRDGEILLEVQGPWMGFFTDGMVGFGLGCVLEFDLVFAGHMSCDTPCIIWINM